ncbi:hypothetical protein NE237_018090 [Protea cynaroides]|uniref:Mei2-like C-terminal RNA recognition motif domain-containing protein n=1 Tax=Protea cynaroides TaxID=273540 RepID=A0A9Q0K9D7_9MAGN|nr:hypothetical protein NE237_018090 [Protea cynaroides]
MLEKETKQSDEKDKKKLGLNPSAKEFKPSNPAEAVERVVVTNDYNQKPNPSHGQKNVGYLRRRFDDNIHKWLKVPLPPFHVILLRSRMNKGYAFVNFTTVAGAFRFFRSYDKHKWDLFNSEKICEIDFAEIQGRENLVEHFMKSTFICDTNGYLPVQFLPPRNGLLSQTAIGTVVGRRSAPHDQNRLKRENNHSHKIWTRLDRKHSPRKVLVEDEKQKPDT